MRETYAERKERERIRDQIREWGIEMAEHAARAEMLRVERTGTAWPRVRFANGGPIVRCECSAPMMPLPVPHKRFGHIQTWFCPYCGLENLIDAAIRVREAAANT